MKGIYIIKCSQEDIVYVGSSINIKNRWGQHRSLLVKENHSNQQLQLAWDAYGDESFTFEVLEETENLVVREQYWLDKIWPYCYNASRYADNPMRDSEIAKKQVVSLRKSAKRGGQKLRAEQIPSIVNKLNEGSTAKKVANEYGVSESTIQKIREGIKWGYVTKDLYIKKQKRTTKTQGYEMLDKYKEGTPIISIAKEFNISRNTVRNWLIKLGGFNPK